MSELLLELFSEEIPARMQWNAVEALKSALEKSFAEKNWTYSRLDTYVTPRRIVAIAEGLPSIIPVSETEKRGPKIGAPQSAIDGFCKGAGIAPESLEERDGYYFAITRSEGGKVSEVLKAAIEGILGTFHWPKSMKWNAHSLQWVRPLQSILCLFDGEVLPIKLGHVVAGNVTKGHRFLSDNQPIIITSIADYRSKLEAAKVIVDQDARRARIEQRATEVAKAHGLTVKADNGLLDEVTGLVEWPVVLCGSFEERYLNLPPEVPTTVMRAHQKYFALQDANGKLAPKFLVVSNMEASDGGKAIIAGNGRVLHARLADGQFFYDQDLKTPLADWAKGLGDMVFHAKIGSVADKVARIEALAVKLAGHFAVKDVDAVRRAAQLCKADLTTGMVGEFPELQGLMGRYYALAQGETSQVADAIRDHYSPQGPSDSCPKVPISIVIALADKLDTLIEMFNIGEKPTGSKDPFALRRAALGIIRLVLDNYMLKWANPADTKLYLPLKEFVSDELFEFLITRLKVMLRDQGIKHDRIEAVLVRCQNVDDLNRLDQRIRNLDSLLNTEMGKALLAGYKRAANIVKAEEDKDKIVINGEVDRSIIELEEEKNLLEFIIPFSEAILNSFKKEILLETIHILPEVRAAIDAFFDKATVNADDPALRLNRLRLLAKIRDVMDSIADFSKIEG